MIVSVSVVDWKRLPVSISDPLTRSAFVRFPLWAIAKSPKASSVKKGCIFLISDCPVVE